MSAKWGDGAFHELIRPLEYQTNKAKVSDYTGYSYGTFELHGYNEGRGYTVNRGQLVYAMHEYARSLGIPIFLNSEVTGYWETEDEAGVVVDGKRISADCVVCAEGIHSSGRLIITGQKMELKETGYAASRGYLDACVTSQDSKLNWILGEEEAEAEDCVYGWLGPGVHFGITTKKRENELFWYCSHKVSGTIAFPCRGVIHSQGLSSTGRMYSFERHRRDHQPNSSLHGGLGCPRPTRDRSEESKERPIRVGDFGYSNTLGNLVVSEAPNDRYRRCSPRRVAVQRPGWDTGHRGCRHTRYLPRVGGKRGRCTGVVRHGKVKVLHLSIFPIISH